jgi:WhiB family redox-sensing transcriptional regulator
MANIKRLPPALLDVYEWQDQGLCRKGRRDLFCEEDRERGARRSRREAGAKRVCAVCPVKAACLQHALQAGEAYGIWGGLTAAEREVINAGAGRQVLARGRTVA